MGRRVGSEDLDLVVVSTNIARQLGGNMAEPGSVAFQFARKGVIRIELASDQNADDVLLMALDAGAEDASEGDNEIIVYTEMKDLHKVHQNLVEADLKIADAGLEYVPNSEVEISDPAGAQKIMNLLSAIDDLDDVVNVSTNANITVEV